MRSWRIGFPAVVCVAFLSWFPAFSRPCVASDLDKIFDLLTKPPKEESNKPAGGSQNQLGLPQLFQIFNKQSAPAAPSGQPKGFLTDALKDVDLGKQIEAKTVELERQLEKVFMKIRAYQAMNGAIWLSLGKNYNALVKDLKSFEQKKASSVNEFINQTKTKQYQHMELVGQVTLDASAGLGETSETIQLNHKKNQKLREAVKYMIDQNPIVGCAFGDVIDNQNVALDSLLDSYMKRLSQITEYQMTASEIFANISTEFKVAEVEMRKAIDVFNEESGLLSVKAVEHMDILYAQATELKQISKASTGGDLYTALTILPKVPSLLEEINRLTGVYSQFKELREKLARQSVQINCLCEDSGAEIERSSKDLRDIGAGFRTTWANQVVEIRKVAEKRRVQVKDLSKVLKEEEAKNKALAAKRSKEQEKRIKEMANNTFGGPVFD